MGCARGTACRTDGRTWPDATRRVVRRPGPVPSRLAGRIAWRSARRRAAMTGAARRSISIRSRIAPSPTSWRSVWRSRSSSGSVSAPGISGNRASSEERMAARTDLGRRPAEVVRVERRLALLGAAALIATHGAPVEAGDRPDPPGDGRLVVHRPDDLVDDERAAARRAAGREQVADGDLEARFAPRRGGQALERRVQVPDVRRPQHDLRQHPRQRARFERDRPPLAVHRRPAHPAATAEQVGHDVTGPGVLIDPGGHHRGRRSRRQTVEDGQRVARLGVDRVLGRSRGRC